MRIYFIGYMGSGKSETAKALAHSLGYDYIDTDQLVEKETGKTINQLFDTLGEAKFRDIESAILQNISSIENCVVATGGGLPCYHDNMKIISDTGMSIYLEAGVDVLSKRIFPEKDKRPLLKGLNTIDELSNFIGIELEKRTQYYATADLTVDAEKEIENIVNTVLTEIRSIPPK